MELCSAVSCFINWTLKYQDNIKCCTLSTGGGFKTCFKSETSVLVHANQGIDSNLVVFVVPTKFIILMMASTYYISPLLTSSMLKSSQINENVLSALCNQINQLQNSNNNAVKQTTQKD